MKAETLPYVPCSLSLDDYGMKECLAPKLSHSCVSYKDLFFDPTPDRVRILMQLMFVTC